MLASNESNQKKWKLIPLTKQTLTKKSKRAKQSSRKTAIEKLEGEAHKQAHATTILQKAKEYPGSLSWVEVQQLQRTLVNHTVTRLLKKPDQPQPIQGIVAPDPATKIDLSANPPQ